MRVLLKKYKFARRIRSLLPVSFSQHYRDYVTTTNFLRGTESWSPEQHKEWQFNRLKELIGYCWEHIPGYRLHWEKSGFHPAQFQSIDALGKIPLVTKKTLNASLEEFSNRNLKGVEKITTGGSTGIPFGFYLQGMNRMVEKAFIHHLWGQFYPSISLKTPSTILRGRITAEPLQYDPLHGLILSSYHLTPENARRFTEAMDKARTPILHAYPSSLYVLSKLMIRYNLRLTHRFNAVMLGSEVLYPFQRELIHDLFKAPVCHWYGHAEKTILAGNCPEDERLHIVPFYGIAEFLNENNQPASVGERGELVGTSLWMYATPFIRYRTMDYAYRGALAHEGCHYPYPLIDRVDGRLQEMVVGRSHTLVTLAAVSIICGKFSGIDQFKFHQSEPGKLVFNYIRSGTEPLMKTGAMRNAILEALGKDDYEIDFHETDSIPVPPSGKLCYLQQDLDIEQFL
jgi:phenylacetate-CoA ligase